LNADRAPQLKAGVMRLINSFIVLLAVAPLFAFAQTAAPQDLKFDEFNITSDFSIDDMKGRLDDFYHAVANQADSRAFVFVYGGKRGYSRRYTVWNVRDYLALRGLSSNRLIVRCGGRRDFPMVELWIVPTSAPPPAASPPFASRLRNRR
jgi:hypothetical protein